MCKALGVQNLDDLVKQTIPAAVLREIDFSFPDGVGESEALEQLKDKLAKNVVAKNFLGQGYHGTIVPNVITRNVLENPGWYTAYTPYQAEISQGRLEVLFAFQTLVAELTGMECANASLLDEGSAAAEAMQMAVRVVNKRTRSRFFVSDGVHPQTVAVMRTRAQLSGIELVVGGDFTAETAAADKDLIGALVQYPDTRGVLRDYSAASAALRGNGGCMVVAADPLALVVAKPPSDFGADIVVGSMQRFGVPMFFGGPAAAFLASAQKHVRKMPGRIIGISTDRRGNDAYRLTLQTREQHIRLDKATSNVCTAQVLLANMSAMYAIYHQRSGLERIASRVHGLAQMFSNELASELGIALPASAFFDTVALNVGSKGAAAVAQQLAGKGLNLRALDAAHVSASFDETHSPADVLQLVAALKSAGVCGTSARSSPPSARPVDGLLQPAFARAGRPFLEQGIFNRITSETEMMRYLLNLQNKDLALDRSMIPLGSCTMKLNPASALMPCTWEHNSNMHPFAPVSQSRGYQEMLQSLEGYLCEITGFDACSLQPNSGAVGEFSGLAAIRDYHSSRGQGHRNVCIIPRSAHGTNPATAQMCGMEIKWIEDSRGMELEKFRKLCEENKDSLAALMVTYPSTRGFFEDNIKEICQVVHEFGGQVYMDGANMNAQLGLTSPGAIGADVCHLNLHKTFAIPHGGGGPGMGPICVRSHLVPHLPGHGVVPPSNGGKAGAVASAPQGQAGIAAIPWMFITMLGHAGVRDCSRVAILNANYMMERLSSAYTIAPSNARGRCSHEFIVDVSDIIKSSGVDESCIAKRLQDYGFHAPTMSWPVPRSLMIEPTESEDKAELDRFCDAMLSIREEIRKVESGEWPKDDNPLCMAPHTQAEVCSSSWTHPYSREEAAFPGSWQLARGKYWPSVARVQDALGDRKLRLRLLE